MTAAFRHGFISMTEAVPTAIGRSAVLLVPVVGLGTSLWYALRQAIAAVNNDWLLSLASATAVFCAFASAIAIARRRRPLPIVPFWFASMFTGALLRLGYVLWAQPDWVSDFLEYWLVGLELARTPVEQVSTIYEQRAMFLTLPVIQLFGESRTSLYLSNIAWLALIQAGGYDLVRRAAGHPAAQAFCVLWVFASEPMLAAGIPSHDLLALALLVMVVWLAAVSIESSHCSVWQWRVVAGLGAGLAAACLQALRGIGTIYVALLAVFIVTCALVHHLRSGRRVAMPGPLVRAQQHVVVVTIAAFSIGMLLSLTGRILDPSSAKIATIRHTAAHATSFSDGTYRFGRDFSRAFLEDPQLDADALTDFRRTIVLDDLRNPLQKLRVMYERMPRQYALGSQLPFYLTGTPPLLRALAQRHAHYYLIGFAALLLYALGRRIREPAGDLCGSFLVLFVTALSAALLLIGENQPRYIFPIWFVGAYLIATCIADANTRLPIASFEFAGSHHPATSIRRLAGKWLLSALAVVVVALVAAKTLAHIASTPSNGRVLTQWQFHALPGGSDRLKELQTSTSPRRMFRIAGRTLGQRSLKLMLTQTPKFEHEVSASTEVCNVATGASLEFFYDYPAKRLRIANPFDFAVVISERERWRAKLPNPAAPVPVSIPLELDADGCVSIRFVLQANVGYDAASWMNASYVEVFFPRLRAP